MGGCSLRARTEPATAMAAETPQTAPPAPSVAQSVRSNPSFRPTKKMTRKVAMETIEACRMATGPAQRMRLKGSPAPSSTMPVLT